MSSRGIERIVWTEDFSVDHPVLDQQHMALVEMTNFLIEELEAGIGDETAAEMVSKLTDYACTHLNYEEECMFRSGYFDFDAHKAEHDAFRRKNGELHLSVHHHDPDVLEALLHFVRNWLQQHILGTDMRYKGLLRP